MRANERKAILLLAGLVFLLLLGGRLLGGRAGMLVALAPAAVLVAAACWHSERLVLWMAGAQEASEADAPELHELVGDLAERAGLPKPRIFLVDDPTPNAFAIGRDPRHAAIALSSGLLEILDPEEGTAIVAHELAHIAARDTVLGGMLATATFGLTLPLQLAAQAVQWVLDASRGYESGREWGEAAFARPRLMAWLAPLLAPAMRLAAPPAREHRADEVATHLLGSPLALVGALEKLARAGASDLPTATDPAIHALFCADPAPAPLGRLFSTRPPAEERIRRLRGMGLGRTA